MVFFRAYSIMEGIQLGPYRLFEKIGAGGMGEVWRAEDTKLLRPAAIKILSAKIAVDPDWKARFLREARTAASLNHPNIATIYSVDDDGTRMYIAMELVEGTSLAALIAARSLTHADVIRIGRQIAEALAVAHEKSIVHRDIKPDNIIVLQRNVKVLDFGIAKMIGPSADDSLTRGQLILGTPYYMSPEQALGKKIDTKTDIFSLGVVMYEALTGKRPFQGTNVTETVLQILTKQPDFGALLSSDVPADLIAIVTRCLQKAPAERFSADDLTEALSNLPHGQRLQTREQVVPTIALHPHRPGGDVRHTPTAPQRAVTMPPQPPSARQPTQPGPYPNMTPLPQVRPGEMQRPPGGGNRRALVTDDDAVTREILGAILRQNGVPYDEAANGAEAIKQIKQHRYGIIFLDLMMPRIDGWGVLDFIRSKGKIEDTKIYVLTAYREQRLSTADQEVVAGLIYKPIEEAEIDRIVQKSLVSRAS